MENKELNAIKRKINHAIKGDLIEIDGYVYQADRYLMECKKKLKKWNILFNAATLVLWLILVLLISIDTLYVKLAVLIIIGVPAWFLHDELVLRTIPDDCMKHLTKL